VVAERGYHDATVSQICAAAGVSRRTFYTYFASKEECYGRAFDLVGEFIDEALAEAGEGEADWPGRVRRRLEALLQIFTANPDLVLFTVTAPLRAGEEIADRHRDGLARILSALNEGRSEGDRIREPSAAVEHSLVGGMMALIAREVESGNGKRLPALLPDLLELFLAPYIGRDRAAQEAEQGG
jgi:AcrR family transcriptional regulator